MMPASRIVPSLSFSPCSARCSFDGLEQHLAQSVTFQKMTEVENGGLVWHLVATDKAPHALNLIEHIFGGWIAEVVEELDAMDS